MLIFPRNIKYNFCHVKIWDALSRYNRDELCRNCIPSGSIRSGALNPGCFSILPKSWITIASLSWRVSSLLSLMSSSSWVAPSGMRSPGYNNWKFINCLRSDVRLLGPSMKSQFSHQFFLLICLAFTGKKCYNRAISLLHKKVSWKKLLQRVMVLCIGGLLSHICIQAAAALEVK